MKTPTSTRKEVGSAKDESWYVRSREKVYLAMEIIAKIFWLGPGDVFRTLLPSCVERAHTRSVKLEHSIHFVRGFRMSLLTCMISNRAVLRLSQSVLFNRASHFGGRRKCWLCLRLYVRRILLFKFLQCCTCRVKSGLHVGAAPKFTFSLGPVLCPAYHEAK
jgi:hypothetical protein